MGTMAWLWQHILNDNEWNPRNGPMAAAQPLTATRCLYLADRLFATVGMCVFGLCFGPQVLVLPLALLAKSDWADLLCSEAQFGGYTVWLLLLSAQSLLAYLRRAYFYDSFATYHVLGSVMVLGHLGAVAGVELYRGRPGAFSTAIVTGMAVTAAQCVWLFVPLS